MIFPPENWRFATPTVTMQNWNSALPRLTLQDVNLDVRRGEEGLTLAFSAVCLRPSAEP